MVSFNWSVSIVLHGKTEIESNNIVVYIRYKLVRLILCVLVERLYFIWTSYSFFLWKNLNLRITVHKSKQRIQYTGKLHTGRSWHMQQSPSLCSDASPGLQGFVRRGTRADDGGSSVVRLVLARPGGGARPGVLPDQRSLCLSEGWWGHGWPSDRGAPWGWGRLRRWANILFLIDQVVKVFFINVIPLI